MHINGNGNNAEGAGHGVIDDLKSGKKHQESAEKQPAPTTTNF
jgi:hypothetical protein